jgi:hypothetical protein
MQSTFSFINEVYRHIAKKYIGVCQMLISSHFAHDLVFFKEEANKLVTKYYRGSKQ